MFNSACHSFYHLDQHGSTDIDNVCYFNRFDGLFWTISSGISWRRIFHFSISQKASRVCSRCTKFRCAQIISVLILISCRSVYSVSSVHRSKTPWKPLEHTNWIYLWVLRFCLWVRVPDGRVLCSQRSKVSQSNTNAHRRMTRNYNCEFKN